MFLKREIVCDEFVQYVWSGLKLTHGTHSICPGAQCFCCGAPLQSAHYQ